MKLVHTMSSEGSRSQPLQMVLYGYENPTRVEFQENNEVVTLSVDQGDNVFPETEYEEIMDYKDDETEADPEVSFKEVRSNDCTTSEAETSEDETENEDESNETYSIEELSEVNQRRRMMELNQEMKTRLIELQTMMTKEGLSDLAEEAAKTLKLIEKGMNKNINSNQSSQRMVRVRNPMTVESEETIYKMAVPEKERNSSSLEDIIDTSDELMNVQIEDVRVINDGLVSDDVELQRKIRDADRNISSNRSQERSRERRENPNYRRRDNSPIMPSTSRDFYDRPWALTPEEKANQLL